MPILSSQSREVNEGRRGLSACAYEKVGSLPSHNRLIPIKMVRKIGVAAVTPRVTMQRDGHETEGWQRQEPA